MKHARTTISYRPFFVEHCNLLPGLFPVREKRLQFLVPQLDQCAVSLVAPAAAVAVHNI